MKELNGVKLNAALLGKWKWLARSSIIDPYEHLSGVGVQTYRKWEILPECEYGDTIKTGLIFQSGLSFCHAQMLSFIAMSMAS